MKRRNFIRNISALGATLPLMSFDKFSDIDQEVKLIKATALKQGDTVGLITPGSYIDDEGLEKAVSNIESLGLKVKLAKNIRKVRGYTAGSVHERVSDIHQMFSDKSVNAVWCARGGYGCSSLLPHLDYELIKSNPKVFIGYSDITVLHQAIFKETSLVTFHGPVASSTFTDYTKKYFYSMLFSKDVPPEVVPSADNDLKSEKNVWYKPKTFKKGTSIGRLVGGNLSLINSLIGTQWELNYNNKILFLEDIGEAPYKIDRMLVQMNQVREFNSANAVVLGVFDDSEKPEDELSLTLEEMFSDNFSDIKVPCSYGYSFGHISDQFTLPLGVEVEVNSTKRTIKFLEAAVV